MELVLNKERVSIAVEADTTVLSMLRERGLMGTKEGCASGDCGACTVMVGSNNNGNIEYRTINACIALAGNLAGKHLVTIEDLESDDGLHPAQKAMVTCHGSQCGFCTPGFVMSLANLVEQGIVGTSTDTVSDQVKLGISGNLCRCTGYRPIVAAGIAALNSPAPPTVCHDVARRFLDITDTELSGKSYARPRNLAELDRLVGEHGRDCIVAGATDFGLNITQFWRRYSQLIDVMDVAEMRVLETAGSDMVIGAAVSYTDLEAWFAGRSPIFVKLLHRLGSRQIRNSGTLGGNIANASPIADTPPALMAWDARLLLRNSSGGEREVRLDAFYVDYRKTVLTEDEYIVAVLVPIASLAQFHRFYKHSKRLEDDISSVMGAFSFYGDASHIETARIAFGGMAAVPLRIPALEKLLTGQAVDELLITRVCGQLRNELTPLSDVRSSAQFRMDMAAEMLDRALREFAGTALPRVDDLEFDASGALGDG